LEELEGGWDRAPSRQEAGWPRLGSSGARSRARRRAAVCQHTAALRAPAAAPHASPSTRCCLPAQALAAGCHPHPSQAAKAYCREIFSFLRTLKASRDMSPNEAKLVVAIESPEARERRKLGIEVRGGWGAGAGLRAAAGWGRAPVLLALGSASWQRRAPLRASRESPRAPLQRRSSL
jgi:hypothetical protein